MVCYCLFTFTEERISTHQLVPGDILLISPVDDKMPFYCDAVLVEGICSVDESVLTGESNPITKVYATYRL